MTPLECRRVRVHGHVQGVGFREACIDAARRCDVTGWVRNRMDGSVEAMLQGAPERVDALCAWLRDGDTPGLVDRVDVESIEPPFPRHHRFERMPTS